MKNELRLNNWIWGVSERMEQISELQRDMVETVFRGHLYNYAKYEDISPIELSPELLEKCGFNYGSGNSSVLRLEIDYIGEDYPCTLQVSGSGIQICRSGIGAICPAIFYLHQLQNLYFALTNTELTITL